MEKILDKNNDKEENENKIDKNITKEENDINKKQIHKIYKFMKYNTCDRIIPKFDKVLLNSVQNKLISRIRRNSSVPKKFSTEEEFIFLKEFPKSKYFKDETIKKLLRIVNKSYYKRKEEENKYLISFFKDSQISNKLRSDFLNTNYKTEQLIHFISQFLSIKIYEKNDIIYTFEEKSELIYIILRGNIGIYQIEFAFEEMTFEDYLLYLFKEKQLYDTQKNSFEDDNGELGKEFVDDYILKIILEENKDIYKIKNFSDISKLNDILFLIKIYNECHENEGQYLMELYNKNNYSYDTYNYEKLLNGEMNINEFRRYITSLITEKESYYMKNLTPLNNTIKKVKYVRYNYLNENDLFGNFEIINTKPLRNETARCDSKKVLLLSINKKIYSTIINDQLQNIRQNELNYFHRGYFLKSVNKQYFQTHIYSKFNIKSYNIGEELFKENEKLNNFYIMKEGTLELSLNNISILELKELIIKLYDLIKKEINLDINLNKKINYPYKEIINSLNLKRKFLVYTCQKDIFGEYELCFNFPTVFTATVVSKDIKLFLYSYKDFIETSNIMYQLKTSLKEAAIKKIQYIIERLIIVYDSYFNKIDKELQRKNTEELYESENLLNNSLRKTSISPNEIKIIYKNVKNNANYSQYNNNLLTDLKNNILKLTKNEDSKDNSNSFYKKYDDDIYFKNKRKNKVIPIGKQIRSKHSFSIRKNISEENTQDNKSFSKVEINKKSFSTNKLNEYHTIFSNRSIKAKQPKRYYLPPLITNNSINNSQDTSFNEKIALYSPPQNKIFSNLFKTPSFKNKTPMFIKLYQKKIPVPLKIEKNVPLINKIKVKLQNLNNSYSNNKINHSKKEFNPIVRDYKYKNNSEKQLKTKL